MDSIDRKMISILQKNSRISVSKLSEELSLSRPSINERLIRLQEKGVIEAFTLRLSFPKMGRPILLIIHVSALKVMPDEFEEHIKKEKDVLECYRVTGESSHILKAAVQDVNAMRELIDRLIPFGLVNTSTVLSAPVEYRDYE